MDRNDGPNMEMRALLAIVLSMVVLSVYQYFFVPPPAPVEPATAAQQAEPQAPAGAAAELPQEAAGAAAATAQAPQPGVDVSDDTPREISVRNGAFDVRLTNVGARIASYRVPGYVDESGEPLDLLHPAAAARDELLFGIETPTAPDLAARLDQALFVVEARGGEASDALSRTPREGDPVVVTFRYADASGWDVEKTFTFRAGAPEVGVTLRSRAPGDTPTYVSIGPGLDPVAAGSSNVFLGRGAVVLGADGLQKWAADDLEGPVAFSAPLRWAGVESHYFLGAFLLDVDTEVRVQAHTLQPTGDGDEPVDLVSLGVRVPPGGLDAEVYLGPKKYDLLVSRGRGLESVVDFGWFGIIARPLLMLLNWIYSFVANYGVAIILLTVLLRLVFLPLNHKAMVSMRRTQQLQPQMAAIRAKYKGAKEMEKRQAMNEEIMELYRREGVSPFGGCLPMLAQLPILFAFYRLLSIAVELRGAPFTLWVTDLSRHDPYLVLPLLMGGSMLVQQQMTPTAAANPAQARMMRLMPVVFTALFLYVPSGLVLYWLVNNLLGIVQQVYVNRSIGADAKPAKTPSKGKKKPRRGKK